MSISEAVLMAQRALCWASLQTLHWYSRGHYRNLGWTLNTEQIDAYYVKDDLSLLQGTMTKVPQDNSRWKQEKAPRTVISPAVPSSSRWDKGFGIIVSADGIGGLSPVGYGGIYWIFVFYDPGHKPGFTYCTYLKKGVDGTAVTALKQMVRHWQKNGHHIPEWGQPVVELRADSGSFKSAAVYEFCEDQGIKQSFSAPHSQNQNFVEAQIRRLFKRVTVCFAHAKWLPRHLWPYVIAYCCLCANLRVYGPDGPSWEAFYGRRYSFKDHPLMLMGMPVQVWTPKDERTWKFGPRSFTGMYLGTPMDYKGAIYVYHPGTGKVHVTRDYRIMDVAPDYWPLYTKKEFTWTPAWDPREPDRVLGEGMTECGGDPDNPPPELTYTASDIDPLFQEVQPAPLHQELLPAALFEEVHHAPIVQEVLNAAPAALPQLDLHEPPVADIPLVVTPAKDPAQPMQLPLLPVEDMDGVDRPIYVDESVQPEALDFDYVGLQQTGDDDDDVLLFRHQAHWHAGRRYNAPRRLRSKLAAAEDLRKLKRVLAIAQGKARKLGTKKRHVDNPTLKDRGTCWTICSDGARRCGC